jgi:ADP-dependent phosphofructokinase/glucokinase
VSALSSRRMGNAAAASARSTGPDDWHTRYMQLAERLMAAAPTAKPVLISSTVNVDEVFTMTTARLAELVRLGRNSGGTADKLVSAVLDCLADGRDGELFWEWSEGVRWARFALGVPERVQVGGTGAQAAWTLAALGAPCVIALGHRSTEQLSVMAPQVLLCANGSLVPVRDAAPSGSTAAARHEILEFARGTSWEGLRLSRSSRLILRFAAIAPEVDAEFRAMQGELSERAGAALLSGLNGLASGDTGAMKWSKDLGHIWKDKGVQLRHLELGDTGNPGELRALVGELRGLYSSVGVSYSELQRIWGASGDVGASARDLGVKLGCDWLVVHSDQWSLAAHRSDPAVAVQRLMAGNLLASARALNGAPSEDVRPAVGSDYPTDIPGARCLVDGWRVDCAPVPYIESPKSTIGLGDTFTAGLLLAGALEPHL